MSSALGRSRTCSLPVRSRALVPSSLKGKDHEESRERVSSPPDGGLQPPAFPEHRDEEGGRRGVCGYVSPAHIRPMDRVGIAPTASCVQNRRSAGSSTTSQNRRVTRRLGRWWWATRASCARRAAAAFDRHRVLPRQRAALRRRCRWAAGFARAELHGPRKKTVTRAARERPCGLVERRSRDAVDVHGLSTSIHRPKRR